jgi:hypothetical protein
VFQKVVEQDREDRVPALEVFKRQTKQVLLTALLQRPEQPLARSSVRFS